MLGTLTESQIEMLLKNNIIGRIACYDGKRPYVVPVCYVYNDSYIIVHSKEGLKTEIMRRHPDVCFEVDEIKDPGNWQSVIAWGRYEEITDEKEKYYAMKFLVSRLMQQKVSETTVLRADDGAYRPDVIRPVIYRIRLTEKSGRYESES